MEQNDNNSLNSEINSQLEGLTNLGEKAAEMQSNDRSFMEPKPPKKKRGRPSEKDKREKEETLKAESEAQGPASPPPIDPMFKMIAARTCSTISHTAVAMTGIPENAMTMDEQMAGTEIMAALLQKYAPGALGDWGLEIAAITTFGTYFWRVKQTTDAKIAELIKAQKMKEAEAARNQENNFNRAADTNPTDIHFPTIQVN